MRGEGRIRAARFPVRKSLEDFDYEHARGRNRQTIAHLGTLDFIAARDNVVLLGHPAPEKPTWPPVCRPRLPGRHRVQFVSRIQIGPPASVPHLAALSRDIRRD